jgi:acetyl esterase/lipase
MSDLMTPHDYIALPEALPDERISYGPEETQFGDLFLPRRQQSKDPVPVVILAHGGCWRDRFGLAPLGQLARRMSDLGAAVWSVEFRRLGGGGGWPTTFTDIAAGADFLRTLANSHSLDLSRVIAAGHSAGGHLALWLAARHTLAPTAELFSPAPLPIQSVISLAGIPDLEMAQSEGICAGAPGELMGGEAHAFAARYREGSPHRCLPLGVPHVHIVGEQDTLVPAAYVTRFVDFASGQHEDVTLHIVPNAGHFEIVNAQSFAFETVAAALRDALEATAQ